MCSIGEMLVFYVEECCLVMLIYVVDFYVENLYQYCDVVIIEGVMMDKVGYYVLVWLDLENYNYLKEW